MMAMKEKPMKDWSCECGWKAGKPGQLIKCGDPKGGPYYCPDCSEVMNVFEYLHDPKLRPLPEKLLECKINGDEITIRIPTLYRDKNIFLYFEKE